MSIFDMPPLDQQTWRSKRRAPPAKRTLGPGFSEGPDGRLIYTPSNNPQDRERLARGLREQAAEAEGFPENGFIDARQIVSGCAGHVNSASELVSGRTYYVCDQCGGLVLE